MLAFVKPELVPAILNGTKIHAFQKSQRWRLGLDVNFISTPRTWALRLTSNIRWPVVGIQTAFLQENTLAVDGHLLDPLELTLLARQEGLVDSRELLAFFAHSYGPGPAYLIHWTDFRYLHPTEEATPNQVAEYLLRVVRVHPNSAGLDARTAGDYLLGLGNALVEAGCRCTTANVMAGVRWSTGPLYKAWAKPGLGEDWYEFPLFGWEHITLQIRPWDLEERIAYLVELLDPLWGEWSGHCSEREPLADREARLLLQRWEAARPASPKAN